MRTVAISCAALLWSAMSRADAGAAPAWPDTVVARLEALALLQTLDAELLSHDSATLTLEHWCDIHRLASPARIVAERVRDVDKAPSQQQRQELAVSATEPVRYRRVKLVCGTVVMSEADNWYVPSRLTPEMNQLLDGTDTPFGKAVQALKFHRRTLSATLLWSPLAEGWEMGADRTVGAAPTANAPGQSLNVPAAVLQHRAVLSLRDGTPFSEVVETYTGGVLAFPAPKLSVPKT